MLYFWLNYTQTVDKFWLECSATLPLNCHEVGSAIMADVESLTYGSSM